ncbi:MAG: methionine adenosyltransferase domain-containing protein, partial [Sulfurovaceae bacterium]|nr:methionine adenosyltransferase domain-containing protein [Sulfurovaceae bacterium]
IDTHGDNSISNDKIINCIQELFDLSPAGIIKELELLKPIYRKTATYGHFGHEDKGFGWEKINRVNEIKSYLNIKK